MEREWIDYLLHCLPTLPQPPELRLGIGDDAALLAPSPHGMVLTTDLLTEGVDFLLEKNDPFLIGRKAVAVNLSDLAAMAAEPVAILVSVALPQQHDPAALVRQLFDGMRSLLQQFAVGLIGGDTNTWNGGLVISITAIGRATDRGVWRRSGGQPGDRLFVTGTLGGSFLERQFAFTPRVAEALSLQERYTIHAALDISDGLALDLDRLSRASGLGAEIDVASIPIDTDAILMSRQDGRTPLEHALSDGEDFELLLAVPESEAVRLLAEQPLQAGFGVLLHEIGQLTAEPGLRLRDGCEIRPLEPTGFLHH